MTAPVRGGIYPYRGALRQTNFLVVSIDALNQAGTVIVTEVTDDAPSDVRGLLAVQLPDGEPLAGSWVLGWRINYATAARFDVDGCHGIVGPDTMRAVLAAITPL